MGGGCCSSGTPTYNYPVRAGKPVGKQIHHLFQNRLRQFVDEGQYRPQSLIA